MTPSLVSVVIPAKNAAGYITDQLRALADQANAPWFEVIVCDNGSTDETAAVVKGFAAPYPLRVLDAAQIPGPSHARNVGVVAAHEFVLFCDADDRVRPGWVAALTAGLERGELVAGRVMHEKVNDADVMAAYDVGRDDDAMEVRPFAGVLPTVAGASFAVRRAAYIDVGGMDSSYQGGCEETDLAWRMQRAGARFVAAPDAQVDYNLRKTANAIRRQQAAYQRNRVLLWMRFRDQGMQGPSLRASAVAIMLAVAGLGWCSRVHLRQLRTARILGAHLGAVQGMMRFRGAGRVPPRRLMGDRTG